MGMMTLFVLGQPKAVGESDLIKKKAREIGLTASIRPAQPEHIRALPGVKALNVPAAAPAPAPLRVEGVGAGEGYVPDSPAKSAAIDRNFARMARAGISQPIYRSGKVHITAGKGITYIFGAKKDVEDEAAYLLKQLKAGGTDTEVVLASLNKTQTEWYAKIVRA